MHRNPRIGFSLIATAALLLVSVAIGSPATAGAKGAPARLLFDEGVVDEHCDSGEVLDLGAVECTGSAHFDLSQNTLSLADLMVASPSSGRLATDGKGWERALLRRADRIKRGDGPVTYTVRYEVVEAGALMNGAGTSADVYVVAETEEPGGTNRAVIDRLASSITPAGGSAQQGEVRTIEVTAPGDGAAGVYGLSLSLVGAVNHAAGRTPWAGTATASGAIQVLSVDVRRS